jgi:hypothetical protein
VETWQSRPVIQTERLLFQQSGDTNIMNYRGFEVRENTKRGIWQAITPTALHWEDGLSAPDRFALKTAIDAHRDNQRSNPWNLPSVQEVAIAA